MKKSATAGLLDEKTVHKKALKNALILGSAAAAIDTAAARHLSGIKPTIKGSLKRAAGYTAGLAALQEGLLLATKKRRDAGRAAIDARHAAKKMEKGAEAWRHATEIGGLGLLAVPSAKKLLRKKPFTPEEAEKHERSAAKYELAGLGILAAPSALDLAQGAFKRARLAKAAAADPELSGRATTLLAGRKPLSPGPRIQLPAPKPKFTPEHLRQGFSQLGVQAPIGSVARPIPTKILKKFGAAPIGLPKNHQENLKAALAKLRARPAPVAAIARNAAPAMAAPAEHLSMVPGGAWTGGAPHATARATGLDRIRGAGATTEPFHVQKLRGRVTTAAPPVVNPVRAGRP